MRSSLLFAPGALALVATTAVFSSGCTDVNDRPLTIGVKGFSEQRVMAEIVRLALKNDAGVKATIEQCGDTFACHAAFKAGKVDILLEYSGTAALYRGIAPAAEDAREQLVTSLKQEGGVIIADFGFNNDYRVAVAERRAAASELSLISDINVKLGPVAVAAPATYLRRPGDGLGPLLSHYGIRRRGRPVVIDDPVERIQAVLDGRADIAVVYDTDGALVRAPVRLLDDDDAFFPRYDAMILAKESRLKQFPSSRKVLEALNQVIPIATMREMNEKIELGGYPAPAVAAAFWADRSPTIAAADTASEGTPVKLAVRERKGAKTEILVATQALRAAFAPRPVTVVDAPNPAKALARGRAHVALMEASEFFSVSRKGATIRTKKLAAAAVVGTRVLHALVRREDRGDFRLVSSSKIGTVSKNVLGRVAVDRMLVAMKDAPRITKEAPVSTLVQALAAKEIDCALVMVAVGDTDVANAMRDGGVALGDLSSVAWNKVVPALRPARIPAGSYPNQGGTRAAFRTQVVLASTSRASSALRAGPAAALVTGARPLTPVEVEVLAAKTNAYEAPDSALPDARGVITAATPIQEENAPLDTVLNALTILFLLFTAFLIFRRGDDAA